MIKKSVYVVVDNKDFKTLAICFYEKHAKSLLAALGNEKVDDDYYRFGYETRNCPDINWE